MIQGSQSDEVCIKLGFNAWICVEAWGYSGGVWFFWKGNSFSFRLLGSDPQFIHGIVQHNCNGD